MLGHFGERLEKPWDNCDILEAISAFEEPELDPVDHDNFDAT
jgi:hypothetical protein